MGCGNTTPGIGIAFLVEECSCVGESGPQLLTDRPFDGIADGGPEPVHEGAGGLFSGPGLDTHHGEGLVINLKDRHFTHTTGRLGYDNLVRIGTHRWVLLLVGIAPAAALGRDVVAR